MNVIFDILDNTLDDTLVIITVIFSERYNLTIIKEELLVTLYMYDTNNRNIFKFYGSTSDKKYMTMRNCIIQQIDNTSIDYLNGISSIENKEYLSKMFVIKGELTDSVFDFTKSFI